MPNFVSFTASIAELAHGENSHAQSITHSPSLFDAPETEAYVSENMKIPNNNKVVSYLMS